MSRDLVSFIAAASVIATPMGASAQLAQLQTEPETKSPTQQVYTSNVQPEVGTSPKSQESTCRPATSSDIRGTWSADRIIVNGRVYQNGQQLFMCQRPDGTYYSTTRPDLAN